MRCVPLDERVVWNHEIHHHPQGTERVKALLAALQLRRLKTDSAPDTKVPLVALPTRTERTHRVALRPAEQCLYDETFAKTDPCSAQENVLRRLLQLRLLCCHPALLRSTTTAQKQTTTDPLAELSSQLGGLSLEGNLTDSTYRSTKDTAMLDCLRTLTPKDKVVVLSQFTSYLDILQYHLRTEGVQFLRLDGQTPVSERHGLVKRFNSDSTVTVLLLSIR